MAIILNTISETIEFLNTLDGWGIIFEDEDLVLEKLNNTYSLEDDYTSNLFKDYKEYLTSHIEWEHIEMDIKDKYNINNIDNLDFQSLKRLAEEYNY